MKFNPHEYQEYGINKIIETPKTGLFLDMGLGKTITTLTAIDKLMFDYFEINKVLVIAPLRVARHTWPAEIEKWDHTRHLRVSKILGSRRERENALKVDADIYLINKENVIWLVEEYGNYSNKKRKWGFKFTKPWPFNMVVIDESSAFKSHKSKRFKLLKKTLPFVDRMVELTGTPAPNGLIDLWSQLYLLDEGKRLGKTISEYRARFFKPADYVRNPHSGQLIVSKYVAKDEELIYDKIEDICVSMKADDYLEMPETVNNLYEVELDKKAKDSYDQLEKEFILQIENNDIDNDVVAGSASVLANKLLQMANGAVYTEESDIHHIHDHKLDALEDLIEAANGRPVLVFYSYKHDKSRILERFEGVTLLEEDSVIDEWNKGNIPILLAHPASTGHGLNLQDGSNYIVWFGLNWSLELYQQANARLRRQGQKEKRVFINHIIAKDTYDERVVKALEGKEVTQEDLMAAVKARINEIKRRNS